MFPNSTGRDGAKTRDLPEGRGIPGKTPQDQGFGLQEWPPGLTDMRPDELAGVRQRAPAVLETRHSRPARHGSCAARFAASRRHRPRLRPRQAASRPRAMSRPIRPGSGPAESPPDRRTAARSADRGDRWMAAHRHPRVRRDRPCGSADRRRPWSQACSPDIVRSVHGETSQAQAGNSSPAARSRLISPSVRLPPALSPPTAMLVAAMPCRRRKRHAVSASSWAAG